MNDWREFFNKKDSFFSMLSILGPVYYPYYAELMKLGFTHQQASELAVEYKAVAAKKIERQEEY